MNTVTERVLYQEQYSGDGPFCFGDGRDGSLDAVIESLMAIRNSITEQYREKARCEIDSTPGYEDSHYATIEITFPRPETDEEAKERIRKVRARAAWQEQRDRETFERLKARYGS